LSSELQYWGCWRDRCERLEKTAIGGEGRGEESRSLYGSLASFVRLHSYIVVIIRRVAEAPGSSGWSTKKDAISRTRFSESSENGTKLNTTFHTSSKERTVYLSSSKYPPDSRASADSIQPQTSFKAFLTFEFTRAFSLMISLNHRFCEVSYSRE